MDSIVLEVARAAFRMPSFLDHGVSVGSARGDGGALHAGQACGERSGVFAGQWALIDGRRFDDGEEAELGEERLSAGRSGSEDEAWEFHGRA